MKPRRNDLCPCGSGKKYKKCCYSQLETNSAFQPMQQKVMPAAHRMPSQQEMDALALLYNQQRYIEAELLARSMITSFPRDMHGWQALGAVLRKMGRHEDALAHMQQVISLFPGYHEAHYNLGNMLNDMGRLAEAEASYRRALQIKPDYVKAHNNLGNALLGLNQFAEAEICYRRALQLRPDYAEAHNNLGNTLKDIGRAVEAESCYRRALQLKPDYDDAYINLGVVLQGMNRSSDAEACYRRALEIKPNYAEAHYNLGITLQAMSRTAEAEACFRLALELRPDYVDAHSNLIFTLDISAHAGISALHDERKKWAGCYAKRLLQHIPHLNMPDPERQLRIGYVSADFREHSAARVFGAMLLNFDRSKFEVFAYSNSTQADALTQCFMQNASYWRNIAGLSDKTVADMIRQDKVDILVDLSGFSRGNRLLVFARKPAPIQITAWGYATGTGMQAMDVFFTDPVLVPPDEKQYYTEQVRYLPCAVTYLTHQALPAVNELPALKAKEITFGSFNRLAKVSDDAYQTWAQVLLANPGSRMLLKAGELDDERTKARVVERFTNAGIATERISMLGQTSWHDHMVAFSQIDISLDPFPLGGGVSAMEGLLMGVPVVTLRWPTLSGRVSASIQTTLGLTDWIAETPEQYVEIAGRKAQDISALAELRQQLRPRFMSSVLGDTQAYVRVVEQEYRQLWREWCDRKRDGVPQH